MSDVVLDASVILASLLNEPGGDAMEGLDAAALLSAVNLAEVRTRLADRGYETPAIDASMSLFDLEVVDFDSELAVMAADLRSDTRKAGLSLGDRACLALAQKRGAVALTADRAWTRVEAAVEIRVVR